MPTTSPLKRPSGAGRLRRLLASLRPPARAGPLPVQTGFPTSLADIVVKNHGRLRTPRRRHRAAAAAAPVALAHDAAAPAPAPAAARPGKGAGFSVRPGILAAGGAVALALLAIWSKQLVAAATVASVALSWIESAGTVRRRRPETEDEAGNGASAADDDTSDPGRDDLSAAAASSPTRKQSRRSLRKLLAKKLRSPAAASAGPDEVMAEPPQPEAIADDDRCRPRRRGALPLPALVPIVLAGLVAGKLPALALAVLCAAFSSKGERELQFQQGSR